MHHIKWDIITDITVTKKKPNLTKIDNVSTRPSFRRPRIEFSKKETLDLLDAEK